MNSNCKIAIEFLLWSYFKLTKEESKDNIIKKCIELAYDDATNQGAYNTVRNKETERKPSYSEKLFDDILSADIVDFDQWHQDICEKMTEYYKDVKMIKSPSESAFTYGNAQKWLNMTVKYLFIVNSIMEILDNSEDFGKFYKEKFKKHECKYHVPIDSYIIESLWNSKAKTEEISEWLPVDKNRTPRDGTLGEYSSDKYKVWSQFNREDYNKIKRHIEGNLSNDYKSPLEWENRQWIEIAKSRRNKKTNN